MNSNLSNDTKLQAETGRARLQVIEGGRKKARPTSATLMNQHIRQSIYRVVFESDLNVSRLQQVAMMFRVPERTVLDALRETVRERQGAPLPPAPAELRPSWGRGRAA